jgi:tetratricopeptide (TPR) repeat protein
VPIATQLRWFGLLLMISLPGAGVRPAAAGQPSPIAAAYEAYMAGQYASLLQAFPNARAFDDARRDLQRTLQVWVRDWRPSYAAFLLDLSFVAFDRNWEDAPELLGGIRDMLVGRKAEPGTDPSADAFELTFHRTAVTYFLSRLRLDEADAYLNTLAGRVDLEPATTGRPRLVDPWMAFARAMWLDIQTGPGFRDGPRLTPAEWDLAIPPEDRNATRLAEQAAAEYERLRPSPQLAAEAAACRGLLLVRLHRYDEALAAFYVSDAAGGDRTVRYFSALFRGRVLEALGRLDDAARAYERAASVMPGAQTPAVALASLWQRSGDPVAARRWADRAASTPIGAGDPWWWYWRGDLRHAGARLDALRSARP